VYNNAPFSEADKENIRKTKNSMKRFDAVSVGRFGLGFNCAYHVTGKLFSFHSSAEELQALTCNITLLDTPCLLSTGTFMIFDPLQYFSTPKNPGKQYSLRSLTATQLQHLSPYLNAFQLENWCGDTNAANFDKTIFRLPLRETQDTSKTYYLSKNVFTYDSLLSIINDIRPQALRLPMFLNNVQEIEFLVRPLNTTRAIPLFKVRSKVFPNFGTKTN
jgi:hypothetical protein